ncbi:peptidoglycan-binding domain-containing protein [Stomatohabitans albus]|uniref:peptidoglycan-binding domain-containing protein n=1 Tax=Stomatohabitans albus TaxID=3110766 RepID=UPI00300D5273
MVDRHRIVQLLTNKIAIGIFALVVFVGLIWLAASLFQSPAQREANAKPPEPQPIVVPVTKTDLRDDFTVKAKLAAETNLTYSLPSPEGERTVVTGALKRPGDTIFDGVPIIELNDRPVLVFFGSVPMYRTITAGTIGGDVQRLQLALAKLGYNIEADGNFGPRSQSALRRHFKSVGSTVPLCQVEQIDPKTNEPKPVHLPCLRLSDAIFVPIDKPRMVSGPQSGQILSGDNAKVVLSGGGSSLVATIPSTELANLTVGTEATALYNGETIPLTVAGISPVTEDKKKEGAETDQPAPDGGGSASNVTFTPAQAGVFNDLGSNEVLLTVPRSKPILGHLVVPQRAIAQNASGQSSVLVQQPDQFVAVPVNEVGCVAGQCAVESVNGQLREGMMVRVDQE